MSGGEHGGDARALSVSPLCFYFLYRATLGGTWRASQRPLYVWDLLSPPRAASHSDPTRYANGREGQNESKTCSIQAGQPDENCSLYGSTTSSFVGPLGACPPTRAVLDQDAASSGRGLVASPGRVQRPARPGQSTVLSMSCLVPGGRSIIEESRRGPSGELKLQRWRPDYPRPAATAAATLPRVW